MFQRCKKNNILLIFTYLCISILSGIIFLRCHTVINVADTQFHLKRISELIAGINHSHYFPLYSFNQFNGSAVMSMYPYINLFPIYLLSLVVKSKIVLIYIYFICSTFIGMLISFYSSLLISHNKNVSYLFSVIYMLSNEFIGYNFFLMDFGASSSFVFLPLVVFGFIYILKGENNYLILSSGLSLIILSHVPDAVIILTFLFLWSLMNIKFINYNIIINIIKSLIIMIAVTSIFWIPFINILLHNIGIIHMVNPVFPKGISISHFFKSAMGNINVFGIGFFPTITIFLSVLYFKYFDYYIKQIYLLSIFIIIMCSDLIKWSIMPKFIINLMENFQFLYRFLLIPICLLSYIFSLIVCKYMKKRKNVIYFCSIILALGLQLFGQTYFLYRNLKAPVINKSNYLFYKMHNNYQLNRIVNLRPYGTNAKGVVTNKSTGSDYYPKSSLPKIRKINKDVGFSGNSHIRMKKNGYNKVRFHINKSLKNMSMPIVLYKNEHLKVKVNGRYRTYYRNKYSLLTFKKIYPGTYNIKLNNNNNKLNNLRYTTSCIGLLYYLFLLIKIYIKKIKLL